MSRTIGGRARETATPARQRWLESESRQAMQLQRETASFFLQEDRKFGETYLAAALVENNFHIQNGAKLLGNRKIININFQQAFKGLT